jgi:hypothetical protein
MKRKNEHELPEDDPSPSDELLDNVCTSPASVDYIGA